MVEHAPKSATLERSLREGKSVWQGSSFTHTPVRQLARSQRADVIIVGAGISGAFMAHALCRQFRSVIVVDRRKPMEGSTMASTALLQFEIDVPLIHLADQIGAHKAKRAWIRSWRATRELGTMIEAENIRCGYRRADTLYLTGEILGHRAMSAECRMRKRAGLPARYLTSGELKGRFDIERQGGILSPDSGSANPVQLGAGLLRRAVRNGAVVYSPVEIRDVLSSSHGVVLDTGTHFLEARFCIFCTGYELLKNVPKNGVKITSSWAMASRPHALFPKWLAQTLVWEASDPYLYIRSTPDHRILVGGEDEDDGSSSYRARVAKRKVDALCMKVKKLLPDADFTISKSWSGAFGTSADGLPIIDAVPGMEGCFAVMGIGGNGTIFSFIASQILPKILRGQRAKDADLYYFR